MTRRELIESIRDHEDQCARDLNTSFRVDEVMELADGILAVRDTDGEHTLYFDQSRYRSRAGAIEDISHRIPDFPLNTGFVEDVTARSWDDIASTAELGLMRAGLGEIMWHDDPVRVQY